MEEKEVLLDLEPSDGPKALIQSILKSEELSNILNIKLRKYIKPFKKIFQGLANLKAV